MTTHFDHLVIAATTLADGVAFVERTLGVTVPFGGRHDLMGTHNHLMRLGSDQFLEVIAVDPEASPPSRPRWFGLDDAIVQQALTQGPRLLTWVVRSDDLEDTCGSSIVPLGQPTSVSRGDLTWQFAIPEDGRLLNGGLFPNVMQWTHLQHAGVLHPAAHMPNLGCRLQRLTVHHPHPEWFRDALDAIQLTGPVDVQPADVGSLEAVLLVGDREIAIRSDGGTP